MSTREFDVETAQLAWRVANDAVVRAASLDVKLEPLKAVGVPVSAWGSQRKFQAR